ncbi:MAG TPA: sensor histidine kinase, partial [Rhizobiales bacterium]|nr:sensor histidine kinase [Hyphomicrobiales bacterium]
MRLFGRLPLSLRVPAIAVLLMLVVAFVASQQVLSSLDRLQDERIRELAQLHVKALSVALGPHVLRKDIWEVYDVLERAAGQPEGRRAMFSAVADTHGRVLAATDPRRAPVDSLLAKLGKGAQRPENLTVSRGADRVKLRAPLIYQGRRLGEILTELDISDILAERRQT